MDIMEFLKNNWVLVLVIVIVAVLLLRAMFKLATFALIVGGVLMFAFGYTPSEVFTIGTNAFNEATTAYKKTVQPLLQEELADAKYSIKSDGSFVITTESVEISGTKNSESVTIRYKDKELTMNISALGKTIKEHIETIQSQIPAQ